MNESLVGSRTTNEERGGSLNRSPLVRSLTHSPWWRRPNGPGRRRRRRRATCLMNQPMLLSPYSGCSTPVVCLVCVCVCV
jgi:hypothetical protein